MADSSLMSFVLNAGWVVKGVLFILLFASITSWTIIFQRARLYKHMRETASDFEERFWSGGDLQHLFNELKYHKEELEGVACIFYAGFAEFLKLRTNSHMSSEAILQNVERAMRVAEAREYEILEQQLPFLAITGSSSPFIGLFGTVWGIMASFQALGAVQQASIAMVAPGISEALIATAIGLFTAIPAAIAYNRFSYSLDQIQQRFQIFQEELMNLLQRQIYLRTQNEEPVLEKIAAESPAQNYSEKDPLFL